MDSSSQQSNINTFLHQCKSPVLIHGVTSSHCKKETCLLLLLIFGAYPVLHSLARRVVLSPSCPSSLELGSAVKDWGVILFEAFLGKDRNAHHHWGVREHGALLTPWQMQPWWVSARQDHCSETSQTCLEVQCQDLGATHSQSVFIAELNLAGFVRSDKIYK